VFLNEYEPTHPYEYLFVIHPIEGHVEMLRDLAQHLPIKVIGIQCTDTVPNTSIETIADYYIQVGHDQLSSSIRSTRICRM
jgi:glutamate formiminotransferase